MIDDYFNYSNLKNKLLEVKFLYYISITYFEPSTHRIDTDFRTSTKSIHIFI